MKVVINARYGGFVLPEEFFDTHKDKDYHSYKYGITAKSRTDPDVISFIESYGPYGYVGACSRLIVVDIPDDATDWKWYEYDGAEWIAYVQDGKIHEAEEDD